MIPKECKRIAEVDFPIAVVSKHSAREKSIRHGHPSTLHLWWARRPLAACRAMLLGLLLPDPVDEHCPEEFRKQARKALASTVGKIGTSNEDLRQAILRFMGEVADWNVSNNPAYLDLARGLVKAAHPEETPLVVDPFAGGGSIPLEALRLGCDAFASDLNPVACLILKVMLEDIPRHGPELADELRRVGAEIKTAAEKELAEFYPRDPDGATPIAYLWARTVRCEAPNCGAEIPLVRSFWLSKKPKRKRALRYEVKRPKGKPPRIEFEVFEPKTDREVPDGTVSRAKATCPCCEMVLAPDRVRAQLAAQRGGADAVFDEKGERTGGALMLAVVTLQPGEHGRVYRVPTARDYTAVYKAKGRLEEVAVRPLPNGLDQVPNEPLPPTGTLGFRVQRYGMTQWGDLFTARQKNLLVTLLRLVAENNTPLVEKLLTVAVDRVADRGSSICKWDSSQTSEVVKNTFSRQALPIVWDFAEVSVFSDSTGGFDSVIDFIANVAAAMNAVQIGQVEPADAGQSPLGDAACDCWFTDPPYYDAVPYADLSDFFLVWAKRSLPGSPLLRDRFDASNPLSPKALETVQDETRKFDGQPKNRKFFEDAMARAFSEGRRVLHEEGIGSVVFAHKTTEGWEALLSGMIRGGWVITGSWPLSTEMTTRLRAKESAALATSIHLVCRPRPEDAPVGDWGDVFRELPKRVGDWMERLESEGIRGADLVFACIGPALEIYSRYSKVVDAEEREIPLGGNPEATEPHKRGYLAYVWEVVGRTALEQVLGSAEARARNGAAGALEEDARLTALFLWTLQATETNGGNGSSSSGEGSHPDRLPEGEGDDENEEDAPKRSKKGFSLPFDVVRRFAQPLGIHLPVWEKRIIETSKGVVRLLPVSERAEPLFGEKGASAVGHEFESAPVGDVQLRLFGDDEPVPAVRGRRHKAKAVTVDEQDLETGREATTLDRVHAAMLLQASGQANALRRLLQAEQQRGPEFLRLSNALSALYPPAARRSDSWTPCYWPCRGRRDGGIEDSLADWRRADFAVLR